VSSLYDVTALPLDGSKVKFGKKVTIAQIAVLPVSINETFLPTPSFLTRS
jgi:hypothetical protein